MNKPQTPAIPDLPDDIPPKSDNPSPSKGLREFMPYLEKTLGGSHAK